MDLSKTTNPATGKPFANAADYIAWLEQKVTATTEQLAAEQQKNKRDITWKVSEKTGTICVYGINNVRPITMYGEQLVRFLPAVTGLSVDECEKTPILQFFRKNAHLAALKEDKGTPVEAKKLALRKADTTGVVSHAKEETTTK